MEKLILLKQANRKSTLRSHLASKFLAPMVMLCQIYRPLKTRCYNRKCQSTLIIDRLNNSAYNVEDCKRKKRAKERKIRF